MRSNNVKSGRPIFFGAISICVLFLIFGILWPQQLDQSLTSLTLVISEYFSWYYVLIANFFVGFCLFLAFSKYGKIKLGKNDDKPEFSTFSWISMLIAAGIAVGLFFFGVAEPVTHYLFSPVAESGTEEAAKMGVVFGIFHWGIHGWAIYIIAGLTIGFFCYRKGLPPRMSSTFYHLLGKKVNGPIGNAIDILTILALVFGITTSLGLGAIQLTSGLNALWDIPNTVMVQVLTVLGLTVIFIISTSTGVKRGMKTLSTTGSFLALSFIVFLIAVGPTTPIFNTFVSSIGNYTSNFVSLSLRMEPFREYGEWMGSWTLFYWAWYVAWTPFVGIFVARISKGRTLKEIVLGAVFVPVVVVAIWFSLFGGAALHFIHNLGETSLATLIETDMTSALFAFYEHMPFSYLIGIATIILILIYYITSADAATLTTAIFTQGTMAPSTRGTVIWGIIIGAFIALLVTVGGVNALQAATIAISVPFSVVLLLSCFYTLKGLKEDYAQTFENKVEQVSLDEKKLGS